MLNKSLKILWITCIVIIIAEVYYLIWNPEELDYPIHGKIILTVGLTAVFSIIGDINTKQTNK